MLNFLCQQASGWSLLSLVVSFWVGGCPCGHPVATALGSNWSAVKAPPRMR